MYPGGTNKLHLRFPFAEGARKFKTVCGLDALNYKYANGVQDFTSEIDPLYHKYYVKCKKCARHPDVGMELLRREANRSK